MSINHLQLLAAVLDDNRLTAEKRSEYQSLYDSARQEIREKILAVGPKNPCTACHYNKCPGTCPAKEGYKFSLKHWAEINSPVK